MWKFFHDVIQRTSIVVLLKIHRRVSILKKKLFRYLNILVLLVYALYVLSHERIAHSAILCIFYVTFRARADVYEYRAECELLE